MDTKRRRLGLLAALVIIASLAILGPLVWAKWQVHQRQAEEQRYSWAPAEGRGTIVPLPTARGHKVFISEGPIPVVEFLKFLSGYAGLALLYDAADSSIAHRKITIAADIWEADDEVVKAILEINRFRVFHEVLPSGREVLKVESILPAVATGDDPKQGPSSP